MCQEYEWWAMKKFAEFSVAMLNLKNRTI